MAKSVRIDALLVNQDGSIILNCTDGEPPLSPTPTGTSFAWSNAAALNEALQELEDSLTPSMLALMVLASYARRTGDTNFSNKAAISGRQITVDFEISGPTIVIS